jgi:hypothetical protein
MGPIYDQMTAMLIANQCDLCCYYDFIGPWTGYGFWGAVPDATELNPPTVKYADLIAQCQKYNPGNGSSSPPTAPSSPPKTPNTNPKDAAKAAWAAQNAAAHANRGIAPPQTKNAPMNKQQWDAWLKELSAKNAAKAKAMEH